MLIDYRLEHQLDELIHVNRRQLTALEAVARSNHRLDARDASVWAEAHPPVAIEQQGAEEGEAAATAPPVPQRAAWPPSSLVLQLTPRMWGVLFVLTPIVMSLGAFVLLALGIISPDVYELVIRSIQWMSP